MKAVRYHGYGGSEVLVAEDNDVNQHVISAMLAHLGHRCVIANDGLEALRLPLFPAADVAPLPPKKKKPKKGKGKAATTEEEGEGEEDEDSSDSGLDSADDDSEDES